MDDEFVWLARDEKAPEREQHTIQLKIHVHDRLEFARVPFNQGSRQGRKFNASYDIAELLKPLSQWCSIEAAGNERKLLVHADNRRPHTAMWSTQYFNENRMTSAPHTPYSADLTPSEFYLFGYVKRCLASLSFEDADQLLAAVECVLDGIEKVTLQTVFLE
jgi:hypothetical protein